jgi:hypothetical protein
MKLEISSLANQSTPRGSARPFGVVLRWSDQPITKAASSKTIPQCIGTAAIRFRDEVKWRVLALGLVQGQAFLVNQQKGNLLWTSKIDCKNHDSVTDKDRRDNIFVQIRLLVKL